jgi:hypothetical protein
MSLHHPPTHDPGIQYERALKARRDPDFLIIGRTDAFSAVDGSRAELVRRGRTLKELGVDAVMPRGVRAREELAFFRKEDPGTRGLSAPGRVSAHQHREGAEDPTFKGLS